MHASISKKYYPDLLEVEKCNRYSFRAEYLSTYSVSVVETWQEKIWFWLQLARYSPAFNSTQTHQKKNHSSSRSCYPKNPGFVSLGSQKVETQFRFRYFSQDYSQTIKDQRPGKMSNQLQTTFISKWSLYETG
jgi:hypothetical protein